MSWSIFCICTEVSLFFTIPCLLIYTISNYEGYWLKHDCDCDALLCGAMRNSNFLKNKLSMYGTQSVLLINQECAHWVPLLSFCVLSWALKARGEDMFKMFSLLGFIQTYQKCNNYPQNLSVFVEKYFKSHPSHTYTCRKYLCTSGMLAIVQLRCKTCIVLTVKAFISLFWLYSIVALVLSAIHKWIHQVYNIQTNEQKSV